MPFRIEYLPVIMDALLGLQTWKLLYQVWNKSPSEANLARFGLSQARLGKHQYTEYAAELQNARFDRAFVASVSVDGGRMGDLDLVDAHIIDKKDDEVGLLCRRRRGQQQGHQQEIIGLHLPPASLGKQN